MADMTEQQRRAIQRRYRIALEKHAKRVKVETATRYQQLGDAAYRRAHGLPDELPETSRRALAEAGAIHFAGPLPKRPDFIARK